MSEEGSRVADSDLKNLFGGSDDKTGEQLLNDQYVIDPNLAMKTEIKDVLAMSLLDIFAQRAKDKKYSRLQKLLEFTARRIDARMVSKDRKGRIEFKDEWVALMETNMRKQEKLADQIFGGSRR